MTQRVKYVDMSRIESELSEVLDLDDGDYIRQITSYQRKNGVKFVIDR